MDWLTIVYLGLPGTALLGYEGWRYYTGQLTTGIYPNSLVAPGIRLSAMLTLLLVLVMLVLHLALYGSIPMRLETGDQLFLHLSPLSRRRILLTLWFEGYAALVLPMLVLFVLAIPMLHILQVPLWSWILELISVTVFETTIRFISHLWNARIEVTWRHWVWYQLTRWLTLVPVLAIGATTTSSHPFLWQVGWIVSVILTALASFRYLLRQPWDGLYQHRGSRVLNLVLSIDTDAKAVVQYRMRAPSAWLVRRIEGIRHRPLSPLLWLILLRALRQKGVFRTLALLSSVAVFAMHVIPSLWIRLAALGFFVFILHRWWGLSVVPLYDKPIAEQFLSDPWQLRVQASRYRFRFVVSFFVLWVVIGVVLKV